MTAAIRTVNTCQRGVLSGSNVKIFVSVKCKLGLQHSRPELHHMLSQLTVPSSTRQWITRVLTNGRQQMRLEIITSDIRTLSIGATQRCVLFLLLFFLYSNNLPQELFCLASELCK